MALMSSCLDLPNTLIDSKLKEYREVFSFFDRDGGGTITTVELGQVMRTFGWNPSEGDLLVGKLKSNVCLTEKVTKRSNVLLLLSNSDAKHSICNWVGLQAVFASATVLLHSEHNL
jgi:hypothetical protein